MKTRGKERQRERGIEVKGRYCGEGKGERSEVEGRYCGEGKGEGGSEVEGKRKGSKGKELGGEGSNRELKRGEKEEE